MMSGLARSVLWPQRQKTLENIDRIGQLVVLLTQLRRLFRLLAIRFDLTDFILRQAVIVQTAPQIPSERWRRVVAFFLFGLRATAGCSTTISGLTPSA